MLRRPGYTTKLTCSPAPRFAFFLIASTAVSSPPSWSTRPWSFACEPSQTRPCATGSISAILPVARVRHLGHEVVIALVDARAQLVALLGGERRVIGIDVGVLAALERVLADAHLFVQPAQVRLAEDDADRAGLGLRVGDDRVAGHRHVVAAGGRQVRHRNHHRLLLAQQVHLPPDVVGRSDLAAGRIDAHDDALYGGIVLHLLEQLVEAVRREVGFARPGRRPGSPRMISPSPTTIAI